MGSRSGPAPRLGIRHPGFRFAYWLDLDWGHLKDPNSQPEIRQSYEEIVDFSRRGALLLIRSVSGDNGYGALFAGCTEYATRDKLLTAEGVDLAAFYGVATTGGGNQKAIPPSRIVPELLEAPEQRARLRRLEYEVVGDWLDDESRWARQDAILGELAARFGLGATAARRSAAVDVVAAFGPTTDNEEEVLRRIGAGRLGPAHLEVLRRLRKLGHEHGQGHAEVRFALAQEFGRAKVEIDVALDLLGYPTGYRCREVRGRPSVEAALAHPHPFGAERLRKVPLYSALPDELFAGDSYRPVVDARRVDLFRRSPRMPSQGADPALVARFHEADHA